MSKQLKSNQIKLTTSSSAAVEREFDLKKRFLMSKKLLKKVIMLKFSFLYLLQPTRLKTDIGFYYGQDIRLLTF